MLKTRKLRAGQCGLNRAGRRACVIPKIGLRLVRNDFDAKAGGFEEVEMLEPGDMLEPVEMLVAPERGLSGVPLEPDDQEAADELQERLGDVFVQAIRAGVADAMREVLGGVSSAPVEAVASPDSDDAGGSYA
mgnify:CR=1 FL=1